MGRLYQETLKKAIYLLTFNSELFVLSSSNLPIDFGVLFDFPASSLG